MAGVFCRTVAPEAVRKGAGQGGGIGGAFAGEMKGLRWGRKERWFKGAWVGDVGDRVAKGGEVGQEAGLEIALRLEPQGPGPDGGGVAEVDR